MKILKEAVAGTIEPNDCLVAVKPFDEGIKIDFDSTALARYKNKIWRVIQQTIEEMGVENGYFNIQDKGALDYCIKARVITAIKRAGENR